MSANEIDIVKIFLPEICHKLHKQMPYFLLSISQSYMSLLNADILASNTAQQ